MVMDVVMDTVDVVAVRGRRRSRRLSVGVATATPTACYAFGTATRLTMCSNESLVA